MWLVVLSRLAGHGAGGRRQPSRTGRMSKPILQQPPGQQRWSIAVVTVPLPEPNADQTHHEPH
jgi:hypothetical protein